MGSCSFHATPPSIFPNKIFTLNQTISYNKISPFLLPKNNHQTILLLSTKSNQLNATLTNPKGFGTPKKKTIITKNPKQDKDEEDDEEEEDDDREEGVIPEIVTNRMINRMGLTVGIPLFTGLAFFPFFYYLKVRLKIDVPTWVSYGIVSTSWDPSREGSFSGWNEAQKNWPVFWQSLRNGGTSGGSNKK